MTDIDCYERFREILRNDDLEAFKNFMHENSTRFNNKDYTLIIYYEATNILRYFLSDDINSIIARPFTSFGDRFDINELYEQLSLTNDMTIFNIIKTQLFNYYENDYCVNYEDARYEYPLDCIASNCLHNNSNIKLFKYCMTHCHCHINILYITSANIEFFKVILKHTNDDRELNQLLSCINEEQLSYMIQYFANKNKEFFDDDQISKIVNTSEYISTEYIRAHFTLTESVLIRHLDPILLTRMDIIEECLDRVPMNILRNDCKHKVLRTLISEEDEILNNNTLKNKFIDVLKGFITEDDMDDIVYEAYCSDELFDLIAHHLKVQSL